MTPEQTSASYARALTDRVTVSRGATTATNIHARVVGYEPAELVGGIVQGDRKAILLYADLVATSFPLPIVKTDRITWNGRVMSVMSADDATRRAGAVTVAIEVQVRGA